jgi:hypothetical protein
VLALALSARRKATGEASSKASSKEYLGFVLALSVSARRKASDKLTSFTSLRLALRTWACAYACGVGET